MWTQFMDMHSGGGQKLEWAYIYIEAPEDQASIVFYNRFGRNPHKVTCTCCGNDYSLDEAETLELASAYQRGCAWSNDKKSWIEEGNKKGYKSYISIEDYKKDPSILIISADEIKDEEKWVNCQAKAMFGLIKLNTAHNIPKISI